ncbi:MAG TPA: SGNH/GDSL hydrolase family protein [Burkholderiales bacterium]|nr:SGNH/GDSL hydrolase family protein [Burkholderiales bacterium]
MATTQVEDVKLRRPVGAALVSLLAALLISACGSGSEESTPSSGSAPQNAAQNSTQDTEWLEAAEQVAAPGGDAALAVEALREVPAAALASARRIRQVVVFGDSLSDVGTYKVGVIAQVGGGKFTTNPGPVWAETLGVLLRARVTPYRQGFGGVSQVLGGTGFAMGGSRVSQQPGIGCNLEATGCTAALTIPVVQQVSDYLAANGDRFNRDQLVFLLAGANDIFFQLGVFQAKVTACFSLPQSEIPSCVDQAQNEALAAVQQAAFELAGQVQRIRGKGATRVVVLNLPELSETPFGKSPEAAPVRPLIAGMVQLFNGVLAAGLNGSGATLLDFHAEFTRVLENPHAFLVREINVPACDAAKIAAITNGLEQSGSSLFCSRQTLLQNGAAISYLFADSVHPTTLGHLIVARFVLIGVWKNGLL